MPWEVFDKYIRSGHRASGNPCRTITLSSSQGIKAIYCKYQSNWAIASYLFRKSKWTLERAKAWFRSKRKEKAEIVQTEQLKVIVPTTGLFTDKRLHSDFVRMKTVFIKRFGDVLGTQKYVQFVSQNKLKQDRPYHPHAQFKESIGLLSKEAFKWANPLITYYRMDKSAKYYKVVCITTNISMNNHDYTDPKKMSKAAISLNYMPVNLNHDRAQWISYPRTRIDWCYFEDDAIEGILRVDNKDRYIQQMLDHDKAIDENLWINHPSIECRPIPPNLGGGYHFVGIALLQKGVAIPGDPCTEIQPLFTESVSASLRRELKVTCSIVDGKIMCKEEKKVEKTQNKDTPTANVKEETTDISTIKEGDQVTKEKPAPEKKEEVKPEVTEEKKPKVKEAAKEEPKKEKVAPKPTVNESAAEALGKAEVLQKQNKRLIEDATNQNVAIRKLKKAISELEEEALKKERRIKELKGDNEDLDKKVERLREDRDDADKERARYEKLWKNSQVDLENETKLRKEAHKELGDNEVKLSKVSKENTDLIEKYGNTAKELRELTDEFGLFKKEMTPKVESMELENKKLKESTRKQNHRIKELERDALKEGKVKATVKDGKVFIEKSALKLGKS